MKLFRAWLFLGLISACSNSNPSDDAGTNDAGNDVTTNKDAANDATQKTDTGTDSSVDAPADVTADVVKDAPADVAVDASDGGATTYTLTINDYLNWCGVSTNGGSVSTADPQTFNFAPDASVTLAGDTANASLFYWGYFQSTAIGDGGLDTSKNVSFNMNGNVSVLACCPLNNNGLHCP